ncbi:MAG: ATP-binding cassette domain-containing protein, partial [Arenicellales bacterium]|nr:ATP-binding cassette domain-containing protein [Arenicellales bacterium]
MNDPLLEIRNLQIDGESDEIWHEIIKGIDLNLDRGEVLGLIGESGAGKSTLGLAAMNFFRPGCRIREGSIRFDGQELTEQSELTLRKLRGVRIAYVAQSAAASFNPAHQLIDQFSEIPVVHGVKSRREAEKDAKDLYGRVLLPDP